MQDSIVLINKLQKELPKILAKAQTLADLGSSTSKKQKV